jgi:hypothetical protein
MIGFPSAQRRARRLVAIGLLPVVLSMCAAGPTGPALTASPSPTSIPTPTPTATAIERPVPPLPRISAVPENGQHQGYLVTSSGERFTPRGANYIRLTPLRHREASFVSTFEPGRYDRRRVEAALAQMRHDGYNVVRTFIDMGYETDTANGEPHGLGRGPDDRSSGYDPYYDNVADFVRRATRHRIYVLPSIDGYPHNGYYRRIIAESPTRNVAGHNAVYMHRGAVNAKAAYARHFVEEMRERLGERLLSSFLAIQLDNEAAYDASQPPFATMSDTVVAPDGRQYDMADRAARQQAADASMVVYANAAIDAIHEVDPRMMVTMGLFTYRAVRKTPDGFAQHCSGECPGEWRYPGRASSLARWSNLSFLDVHIYPWNNGWTFAADLASSEWSWVDGPVIMGEFGAYRPAWSSNIGHAAGGMRELQVQSCAQGFSGWIYWTWDTDEDPVQRKFFTLTEGGGPINGMLAPIVRRDPCRR